MSVSVAECVVDSSVAYKWYISVGEASVKEARELVAEHARGEIRLITPAVMPFELTNALRYSGLTAAELREVAATFVGFDLEVVLPDQSLLAEAGRIAIENDLTIYDASFVALAKLRKCELVTADRKAFASIDECRVRVL